MAIHHASACWVGMQAKQRLGDWPFGGGYLPDQGESIFGFKSDRFAMGRKNRAGTY